MGPLDGVAGAVVTVLGCCTALVAVAGVLQFVWRQILRPAKPLKAYGKWAVVTGGTDGIGKEYALQLAKEGLNILVVSRNEDKLKVICDEVKEAAGVEAKYVAADLCSSEESVWSRIAAAIKDVEVGLLINNAGMSYPYPDYLDALEPGLVEKIIAINATATTKMRERNRGCIVNISSGVSQALPACPLLSAYAASKAYVDELSSSLAVEYAQYGIDVQVQAPAFVATKMSKIRRPSLSAPSPETWVRAGMRHIGHEVQATPYVAHGMLSLVCPLLPSGLVSSQWLGMMKGMRKRALKKAQEAAKEQ